MMKTGRLIAPFVLAASQIHNANGMTRDFNATFDTLVAIPEEVPINPVGIYLNMTFSYFDFRSPDPDGGLITESAPYYAYGVGSASTPSSMAITYPGSESASFALASFYYGCVTSRPYAAASLPVPCNITATGYKGGSAEPVAVQEFAFDPAGVLRAPLAFGDFDPAFQGLQYVTYEQSPAAGTVFFVDNVAGAIST